MYDLSESASDVAGAWFAVDSAIPAEPRSFQSDNISYEDGSVDSDPNLAMAPLSPT